jgi:hypothetical protein
LITGGNGKVGSVVTFESDQRKVEAGVVSPLALQPSTPNFPMKSAYELAMERLEKNSPSAKLTEAQKVEIAEIDSTFKAKIAEQELFLKGKIAEAMSEGKFEDVAQLEQQLAHAIRRFNEDCEAKKAAVRGER